MCGTSLQRVRGFNIIELMVVVAIIGILAAVALPLYRDNTLRANMSEAVLAGSTCRTAVSDGWSREVNSPGAGNWGCETVVASSKFVRRIQTTEHGEIRIQLQNVNDLSGRFIYLKPYATAVPPLVGGGNFAAGQSARSWKCGVADNDPLGEQLASALPSTCRDRINLLSATWAP
ncbi:pilin [Ramlibacter rhizophilus]|nr:pilin [Ramlibacter rhizophilus]